MPLKKITNLKDLEFFKTQEHNMNSKPFAFTKSRDKSHKPNLHFRTVPFLFNKLYFVQKSKTITVREKLFNRSVERQAKSIGMRTLNRREVEHLLKQKIKIDSHMNSTKDERNESVESLDANPEHNYTTFISQSYNKILSKPEDKRTKL